jgi:hypothetical protein
MAMSDRGVYRTKTQESGAEYAVMNYGRGPGIEEIPRSRYEAQGYQPSFDQLPSKQQYKADLAEEIAAMRLAHKDASERPFDDSAAKLLKKIEAATAELDRL